MIDTNRGKLTRSSISARQPARETLDGAACATPTSSSRATGRAPSPQYGFGAEEAARIRPGIVCVSLCAYGYEGPWAGRRGFDSLVQNANGLNVAEAEAAGAGQAANRCRARRSTTPPAI